MTAPTPPFATTLEVAAFVPSLSGGVDFSESTTPKKSTVTTVLGLVSAQIEMQFSMAGYVIPLTTLDSETWPASQTSYLKLLAIMGAVAMAAGNVLKPAPAQAPGKQGGTGNVFQDFFNTEIQKIFNQRGQTTLRFRASYYIGSPAERVLSLPQGPTTDFFEGKYDPMRYLSLKDMADKMRAIEKDMTYNYGLNWDYLYGLFNQPLGTSIYELYECYNG